MTYRPTRVIGLSAALFWCLAAAGCKKIDPDTTPSTGTRTSTTEVANSGKRSGGWMNGIFGNQQAATTESANPPQPDPEPKPANPVTPPVQEQRGMHDRAGRYMGIDAYDKIKRGMTRQQVEAAIGEGRPAARDDLHPAVLPHFGQQLPKLTLLGWPNENGVAFAAFDADGKIVFKSFKSNRGGYGWEGF
jgi:hypothetical protein